MLDELIPLSHCLMAQRPAALPIAYHAGHYIDADQFYNSVKYWVARLRSQPLQRYALFAEDAYPFAILLFALLHAGKEVFLPGNNRPGTARQLQQMGCRLIGDWEAAIMFDYRLESTGYSDVSLAPLDLVKTGLALFTSGSTGLPKLVNKQLVQLQIEVETLENLWGTRLADAEALATVSHQHIYGLLFRVLWPLSAGRCFHSDCYINPETLLKKARHIAAYWISSPAHLKRLDQASPWDGIARLCAVFSSGGALQKDAAQQILTCSGQPVIEVYGSTESGGIAWRQQDSAWTLFEGASLAPTDDGWRLHSPYLSEQTGLLLDDQISLQDDGRFILHGRQDRTVKIEEKRLSLTELEQRLMTLPWVAEAFALVLTKHRDTVGMAIVLTEDGMQSLRNKGRKPLIKQLRDELYQYFDAVILPRKWLFLDHMPLTPEGKIEQPVLKHLLDMDSRKFPYVLGIEKSGDSVELKLNVPGDLVYFPDHFPIYPILPGVVQIAWAEHFGKLFFALDKPFSTMEVIKFVKVIQPGAELKLMLDWKASTGKLYFNFSSKTDAHSSGRMVYR